MLTILQHGASGDPAPSQTLQTMACRLPCLLLSGTAAAQLSLVCLRLCSLAVHLYK